MSKVMKIRELTREEAKRIDVDFIYNMGNIVAIGKPEFVRRGRGK